MMTPFLTMKFSRAPLFGALAYNKFLPTAGQSKGPFEAQVHVALKLLT